MKSLINNEVEKGKTIVTMSGNRGMDLSLKNEDLIFKFDIYKVLVCCLINHKFQSVSLFLSSVYSVRGNPKLGQPIY